MEPYIFTGLVLPQRAALSLAFPIQVDFKDGRPSCLLKVSIVLNQVWVSVDSSNVAWKLHDLRNMVRDVLQTHLSMVGYIEGHAYELEITRVVNQTTGDDYVFGIDIPCLTSLKEGRDTTSEVQKLWSCCTGDNGIFIHRCLNDLMLAMKNAEDTGFYCYRAIEALRNHAAAEAEILEGKDSEKWENFRSKAGVERDTIMAVKAAADPARHGTPISLSEEEREKILRSTWLVVRQYIDAISLTQAH